MSEGNQNQIVKIVDLNASVSRVWRAITDYEEFGQWFRVHLDGPFELGVQTTGHITVPGHKGMEWVSLTERMIPERIFAFSWPPSAVDPDGDYDAEAKVYVEFSLETLNEGTRLTITESGFEQFQDSIRLEVLRSNKEGWNFQAENIATHVAT